MHTKIKLYYFIVIIGVRLAAGYAWVGGTPLIGTIKGLAKFIDSSCCSVLYSRGQFLRDRTRITHVVHQLASDFAVDVSVTAMEFSKFLELYHRKRFLLECKSQINIIFHHDEDTRQNLLKLSYSMTMHDFTWLIYNNEWSLDEWFKDISTPFSAMIIVARKISQDHVELLEVYRVSPEKPLRTPVLGNWMGEGNFSIHKDGTNVYNRRHNLEGLVLRTGSTQNAPIQSFEYAPNGELQLVGFFPAVWKDLEITLNFSSIHYPSIDNVTGIREKDGGWNGLIGMIHRNEIDVGVSEFIMDKQRTHVVDFTRPLVRTSYQIFFKSTGANYNWDAVLKPFQKETWMAILGWLVVASLIMAMVHEKCCQYHLETDFQDGFNVTNSIFFHMKAICSQGHTVVPKSLACRVLYLSAYLVTCVLAPSYSAYLISYLTFRTPRRPFDNLQELLDDGTYKLSTNAKTAEYTYFSEATEPTLQRIYRELMNKIPEDKFPLNTQEALDRVCNDPHLAHFGDMAVAYSYVQFVKIYKQCDIVTLSESISTIYSSMALNQHSPYRMIINHYLQKMEDHGLVDRSLSSAFPTDKVVPSAGNNVDLKDVAQTFILLIGGWVLSLIFLLVEIFHWRWNFLRQNRTTKEDLIKFSKTLRSEEVMLTYLN